MSPKLLRMIPSFHKNMEGIFQNDGSSLDRFPINSGVKQGCILTLTLFDILVLLLLCYTFRQSEDGLLHFRSNGSLFNLVHLHAKTKIRKVLISEMLFADDTALAAHTEAALQEPLNCFVHVCTNFGLTISIKKTNILGQDVSSAPSISIDDSSIELWLLQ